MLCNRVGGACRRRHLDDLRVGDEFVGQLLDVVRQGGREEQCLAQRWQKPDNTLDIGDEAHVQHAVRLVDHQNLHIGQQHLATLEMVEKAAGGGNQNIHTLAEGGVLVSKTDAPDQQRHGQLVIGAEFLEGVGHLCGQLSGGCQDQ